MILWSKWLQLNSTTAPRGGRKYESQFSLFQETLSLRSIRGEAPVEYQGRTDERLWPRFLWPPERKTHLYFKRKKDEDSAEENILDEPASTLTPEFADISSNPDEIEPGADLEELREVENRKKQRLADLKKRILKNKLDSSSHVKKEDKSRAPGEY